MSLLTFFLLSGCVIRTYVVEMSEPTDDVHYVVVEQGPGSQRVYDCMSRPDGKNWQPTCVKVDMRAAPPAVEESSEGKRK